MGRLQLYAMVDDDIPLHPCKQPFKVREIQWHDQQESARSGRNLLWSSRAPVETDQGDRNTPIVSVADYLT
jgi:hypothetical protein